MTSRRVRLERRGKAFGEAQRLALIAAITATHEPPAVTQRIRELAASGRREHEIAAAMGLRVDQVRQALTPKP